MARQSTVLIFHFKTWLKGRSWASRGQKKSLHYSCESCLQCSHSYIWTSKLVYILSCRLDLSHQKLHNRASNSVSPKSGAVQKKCFWKPATAGCNLCGHQVMSSARDPHLNWWLQQSSNAHHSISACPRLLTPQAEVNSFCNIQTCIVRKEIQYFNSICLW